MAYEGSINFQEYLKYFERVVNFSLDFLLLCILCREDESPFENLFIVMDKDSGKDR